MAIVVGFDTLHPQEKNDGGTRGMIAHTLPTLAAERRLYLWFDLPRICFFWFCWASLLPIVMFDIRTMLKHVSVQACNSNDMCGKTLSRIWLWVMAYLSWSCFPNLSRCHQIHVTLLGAYYYFTLVFMEILSSERQVLCHSRYIIYTCVIFIWW